MNRSSIYSIMILVMLSLITGAWAVQAQSQAAQTAERLGLEKLLPLSRQAMEAEQHIIIKHTSTYQSYSTEEQFLHIGQALSRAFGLPEQNDFSRAADHLLYKAESQTASGVRMTLLWVGYTDGSTSLMLTGQTEESASPNAEEGRQAMVRLQQQLGDKLNGLGVTPQWNVMIQGVLSDTFADMEQGQLSVFSWFSDKLRLQEVGTYHDTGSTSISYYSPDAGTSVQVAVHRNSLTHEQRVTIGMPAISVEY